MKSSFIQEFKEFAVKGNAIDMAVGVIIGGAFGCRGARQGVGGGLIMSVWYPLSIPSPRRATSNIP